MNKFLIISMSIFLITCKQEKVKTAGSISDKIEIYNIFDTTNHLQPEFDKARFDTLHSWDFGWAILEPINLAKTRNDDKELSKRFSPGQKALYFFWYLDEEVTNGGFIQFYCNHYRSYLPTIKEGITLIGDNELLQLLNKVDEAYLQHKDEFDAQTGNWEPLYNDLNEFKMFSQTYYKIHDKTMLLIEQYARLHPDEFVKLK